MNALATWIQSPLAGALGWTLFQFLWEGAVIAFLLAAALLACRGASARVRYALASLALLGMLAAFGITLVVSLPHAAARVALPLPKSVPLPATGAGQPGPRPPLPFTGRLAWAVPFWLAGMFGLSSYRLGSWTAAMRLRRTGAVAAPPEWAARVQALAREIGISRPAALLESCLAEVPMVIGFLRPVILVPLGMLAGLPGPQVEAILLHELAHIRRADYLFNLVQSAIEALLFYHPAVWWVSGLMRVEREHCCDDLVVARYANAHQYATALVALEQSRWGAPVAGIAASGGNLLNRIRRLLSPREGPRLTGIPMLLAGVITATLVLLPAWHAKPARAQASTAATAPRPAAGQPTLLAQATLAPPSTPLPADAPQAKRLPEEKLYIITPQERAAFQSLTSDGDRRLVISQMKVLAQATAAPPSPPLPADSPYGKWLNEDVAYIITNQERAAFRSLTSDAERRLFIAQFWLRRDPTPGTPRNEFMEEHYRRIQYANDHFAAGVPGWKTDRGRIYISFGPPDERDEHPAAGASPATDYWHYRFIEGIGKDIQMEFADPSGSGDYHMTMDPAGNGVAVNAPPREFFKLNPPAPVFAVGQVNAPGFWPPSSLKELIGKTGLTASADPRNARITHISPAGERTVEAVDLQAILDGTVPDVPLQSGDVVTIPTRQ